MFEQVNKKLKRRICKAVSIVLSAAMLVTALPADLLGGVANVKAADEVKTYIFDMSDLTAGSNKAAVAAGKYGHCSDTTVTTKYFTVGGTVQQYVASGTLTALYLEKNEQGTISFTVTGTADVTLDVRSNSNDNTSPVALKNTETGNYVKATSITRGGTSQEDVEKSLNLTEGYYLVQSSNTSTLTYSLTAGTYALLSPTVAGSDYGRGVRFTAATVVETTTGGGQTTPPVTEDPDDKGTGDGDEPSDPYTVTRDLTKGDVYDFGLAQWPGYNNILTADMLNKAQAEDPNGKNGMCIAGFTVKDTNGTALMKFDDAGFTNTHRLRVSAKRDDILYHSTATKKDADDSDYTFPGFLYSNKEGTAVRLSFELKAGDILTAWLGANSKGDKTYTFVNQEDTTDKQETTWTVDAANLYKKTFYATQDGVYDLYSNEKMVVGRVQVDHTKKVSVTGTITNDGVVHPATTKLVFTCVESGAKTEVALSGDGKSYSAELNDGYQYEVSLADANGWIVTEGVTFSIALGAPSKTNNIKIKRVDLVTITGAISVSGETANGTEDVATVLAKAKLVAESQVEGTTYVPEITIDVENATYTAKLEKGIDYVLSAENINDYEILSNTWKYDANAENVNVALTAKALHQITIDAVDVDENDAKIEDTALSAAVFTFTNLDDEYEYTFTGTSAIKLRDGVYSVKVSNSGRYIQKLTSNVTVDKKDLTKTIKFNSTVTVWDFSADDWTKSGTNGAGSYNGLTFTNAYVDQTYMVAKAGTVSVPVKGNSKVIVTACYQYSFYFVDNTETSYDQKTNSTSQLDQFVYDYTGEAGTVDITIAGQSYLCKVEVIPVVEYKAEITVNPDGTGDYKTINEALAAAKAMDRSQEDSEELKRVTISIAPGNYEEMLVVDTPNVTLKNASANPSIELKNKGVDIDDNAVRITHYYGSGYTYYSMGTDCKWNAELLEVNKENGYASFKNPGDGKTNGSYWNTTVAITASGFKAEGIIFENSFNQYISKKASQDVIEAQPGKANEGNKARAEMTEGDTTVQDKAYVERAAALAIYANQKEIYFENCKFISRQDTLYGDAGVTAAFYNCSIYGATDYIFGGMTAVFAKCDLVFNTSEDKNDVGHITASQVGSADARGLLMWNCTVISTTPGVDTASKYRSKAGTFGRPWAANGEAVFYETIVEATDAEYFKANPSLIQSTGWNSGLGHSTGTRSVEYNTHEYAMDVTTGRELDNSAKRVSWSTALTEEAAAGISVKAFLGNWADEIFTADQLKIEVPTDKLGTVNNMPMGSVDESKMKLTSLGADADGKGQIEIAWTALHKSEADKYVITVTNKDVTTEAAKTIEVDNATNDGEDVLAGNVTLKENVTGLTVDNTYEVSIVTERGDGADKETGTPAVKSVKVTAEAEEPDDGSPKDPVNGTKFELPITVKGLVKDEKYPGGFSVLADFAPYGSTGFDSDDKIKDDIALGAGDPKTVAGVEYPLWVQGQNSPSPNRGKVPNSGSALILDALEDGVVTIVCAMSIDSNSGKPKNVNFVDGSTDPATAIMGPSAMEDKAYKFEVQKGHKYYFYADGSKIMLCKAYVVYEGKVTDPNFPDDPGTDPGKDPSGTGDGDDKPGTGTGDGDDHGTGDGDDWGTGDGSDSSFDGWDRVARPVINRVEYFGGSSDGQDKKVTVTVTANVGDQGGQRLVVTWKNVNATTTQTKTSTTKQKTHKFDFSCEGPGKYEVTATLKRKGLTDKTTKATVTIKANGKVELTSSREGVHVELLDDGEYTYTGSAIKPAVAVYNGDELLTEGVDYTVKYTNNVKAGNKNDGKKAPTITITGKGKLTGKTTQTFTINKKDLNEDLYDPENGVVVGGMLDGNLVVAENTRISPILVYKGMVLKAGAKKDFELTTGLSKDKAPAAGTAGQTIKIKGVNNYTGELELTLDVRKKSDLQKITAVQLVKGAKYEYNGEKHTAQISAVKAKNATLTALTDYVIVYNGDQTTAGAQKFTVVGLGLYTGSKTTSFKITPRKTTLTHVVDDSLKVNGTVTLSYKSTGVTFNDAITVTDPGLDDAVLVLGKDYKVSYSNNKKAGTGSKYSITFLGNYKGSAALKNNTFTITKLNLADLTQTDYPDERYGELYIKSADKAYGKKAAIIKSAPYVLVDGVALKTSDYTVKYYLSNGNEMKGKDKVSLGAGETATITVQITGKGNCEGTVTTTYEVSNEAKTDISKVKVTPQKGSKKQGSVPYSGSAVYPDQIVITQGKNTLATITPDANGDWNTNSDYEVTFVNNIEKGRATIIVTGTGNNRGSKTATYNVASRNLAKDVASAVFWEDFKDLKDVLFKSAQLFAQ